MPARDPNTYRFAGGLVMIGCALLMMILRIADWVTTGEKLQLGVAVVFMSLGTVLMATSRHRRSGVEEKKT